MHALALDRLDDERCDIASPQRRFQRRQVVEGNGGAIAQQRLEALLEYLVAVQRQRAEGQAVKGVLRRTGSWSAWSPPART